MHLSIVRAGAVCIALFMAAMASSEELGDRGFLQGKWEVARYRQAGVPGELFKNLTLTFHGEQVVLQAGDSVGRRVKFRLVEDEKPRHIDLVGEQTLEQGIYRIVEDRVELALSLPGGQRPKAFQIEPGERHALMTLRRAKEQ